MLGFTEQGYFIMRFELNLAVNYLTHIGYYRHLCNTSGLLKSSYLT